LPLQFPLCSDQLVDLVLGQVLVKVDPAMVRLPPDFDVLSDALGPGAEALPIVLQLVYEVRPCVNV